MSEEGSFWKQQMKAPSESRKQLSEMTLGWIWFLVHVSLKTGPSSPAGCHWFAPRSGGISRRPLGGGGVLASPPPWESSPAALQTVPRGRGGGRFNSIEVRVGRTQKNILSWSPGFWGQVLDEWLCHHDPPPPHACHQAHTACWTLVTALRDEPA